MTRNRVLYALGAVMLGIVGLIVGDFALQWQPVPASVPLRTPLAYLCAALLVAGGAAVAWTKTSRSAALALGSFYGLWTVLLHLPRIFSHPSDVSAWNAFAEIGALAAGGFMAWGMSDADPQRRAFLVRAAQTVFGGCLLIFGTAHFVYADFTATMIPGWLPLPLFWAYLTGCGHFAAGISLVSGVATRLAATLLTAMFACFVVLLHVPRVLAAPTTRIEWTMLGVATALTGAAWIVRTALTRSLRSPPSP